MLQAYLQHLELFRFGQGGRFAGGSQRHQEVHAGFHLPVHGGGKSLIINLSLFERSQERRSATFKLYCLHTSVHFYKCTKNFRKIYSGR